MSYGKQKNDKYKPSQINDYIKFEWTKHSKSMITLNLSGLNIPIKRQSFPEWIKKQELTIFCLQQIHFRVKCTHRLNVKR